MSNIIEPFVSVILPVRNEAAHISQSLRAVLNQNYPMDQMEILVVDGMSLDNTREIVREIYADSPRFPLKLIDNTAQIVPTALNIGFRQAHGNIILRVDGHCIIAPDHVSRCVAYLDNGSVDGVGGIIETIGDTYIAKTIALAMSSPFGVGNSPFRLEHGKDLFTKSIPFPAYTRKIMTLAGPFDEEMYCNEDDEYNYRLNELGAKLFLTREIKSIYYCRSSLGDLRKQYYQYGFWKVRVMQKHYRQMEWRQFAPILLVVSLLFSAVLACFSSLSRLFTLPFAGLLFFYLAANTFAAVRTGLRSGWKYTPLLTLVYITMHLGYGFGFLIGLVAFAGHWKKSPQDLYP